MRKASKINKNKQESKGPQKINFLSKLEARWKKGNFVCVGLDSDYLLLPKNVKDGHSIIYAIGEFNRQIVNATADLVCVYKLNSAFYEAYGVDGWSALKDTINYIHKSHPEISVILDAKRADIGNSNSGYVKAIFDDLDADAVTVHPYLGKEALKPFLDRKDKGIIVLVKTSNIGASEFQDLKVGDKQEPLYQVVARNVANSWNDNGNCAVVVGATYPQELAEVRKIVGNMPILIPGIGAQEGTLKEAVKAGRGNKGMSMIINSSRDIIFASKDGDFAQAARKATEKLSQEINKFRE